MTAHHRSASRAISMLIPDPPYRQLIDLTSRISDPVSRISYRASIHIPNIRSCEDYFTFSISLGFQV
jgi:hypothetical protein